MEGNEAVSEELEDLRAIYESDDVRIVGGGEIAITLLRHPHVAMRIHLPSTYPQEVPVVLLESECAAVDDELRQRINCSLQEVLAESLGEPCCIACIEHVRGEVTHLEEEPPQPPPELPASELKGIKDPAIAANNFTNETNTSNNSSTWTFQPAFPKYGQRPVTFDSDSNSDEYAVQIVSGDPFTDRKSTFQAFLARVNSEKQVQWVLRNLLQNSKIAKATHNMTAHRFWDAERDVQVADNEDDGEDGAGSKMAALLDMMGVNGVFVMVSRWYGGIKLGPDRFKHIATATQQILNNNGFERVAKGRSKSIKGK